MTKAKEAEMNILVAIKNTIKLQAGGYGSGRYQHKKRVAQKAKVGRDGKIVVKDKLRHEEGLQKRREQQQALFRENAKKGLSSRGKPVVSEKAQKALANMKLADKRVHDIASKCEKQVADAVNGEMDVANLPLDVTYKNSKGKLAGIEVKAVVTQSNDKITMKKDAIARKMAYAKANKISRVFSVAVDYRKSASKPDVYFREGVGAFRLGSMTRVENGFKGLKSALGE